MIRHIFWDVDGTLFDTYPALTYAISRSMSELGHPLPINMIDNLARQSISYCIQVLSRRFNLGAGDIYQRFQQYYAEIPFNKQPPFVGVLDVCQFIQDIGGLNIAITHRDEMSTWQMLAVHGLDKRFADVLCVDQGFPRKPDPAMMLAALGRFDLDCGEVLCVGDRELDIKAGQAAGLRTCLFGRDALAAQAEFKVEHYSQLYEMLIDEITI